MAIASISLDFCSEPLDFHCPVCGRTILTGGVSSGSCPHLLFFADSMSDSWTWSQAAYAEAFADKLQERYEQARAQGYAGSFSEHLSTLHVDRAARLAAELVSSQSAFLLSISTSDIGCGGMHNGTLHAIFDFRPEPHKLIL